VHHYAVQAGLGQMGFNGQLLTPQAGSRCRLCLITTDAPLTRDQPRDLGIPRLCEECRICVRRCPSGAIPARRAEFRGVEKNKLNLARCFPVVAQATGCSVCMKVCPVQRYGLAAVLSEYKQSGRILGKDTDELEGYRWPLDGRHYGPGTRPALAASFFDVPGFGALADDGQGAAVDNPLM
jgi:ferredoxin